MSKDNVLGYIANIGEVLVLIGAALWITGCEFLNYVFAVGTLLFAIGRFFEKHPQSTLTLRRLYLQRTIGVVVLIVAALLMFFYEYINGFEISDYKVHATASAWLLPFFIFVVIELYTAFRIPSELKKENK
ncbi:MAG: hypothetical protein K6E52_04475 [Bacteroidaceae bacterium]|jgi:hypothetical protein|nr:hypothetical protein [Bacteroidaceae bacterium]